MSNLSALNRAIIAGKNSEAASAAATTLNAVYLQLRNTGMHKALEEALSKVEAELLAHADRLRHVADRAHQVAAETRVFKLGAYYMDLPKGYTASHMNEAGHYRVAVQRENDPSGSAGRVFTHEKNGDDIGGFVAEVRGKMCDILFSAEHIAVKHVFAELAKDGQ